MDKADLVSRFSRLTRHRQQHVLRVTAVMAVLARAHRLDSEAAEWAGFGHDLARETSRPELLAEAERFQIELSDQDRDEPLLLHGPVAARWLQLAGIADPAVAEAVAHHTTAGPGIGPLARALFVADGVEPGRDYPERQALYELALTDLNRGYREVLQHTAEYLRHRGLALHPKMVAALKEKD